ncbi:MAG: hypothetical protein BroJett003_01600 [Planctomycetota bacterium]|nr:MAG: hypothetical protein BroJett003_01600 [Planctomycetota bacterium]
MKGGIAPMTQKGNGQWVQGMRAGAMTLVALVTGTHAVCAQVMSPDVPEIPAGTAPAVLAALLALTLWVRNRRP